MKEEKRILNVLGQVDEKFIAEAAPGKRANKKPAWIKRTSIAACLALVAVFGVGAGGWFNSNDIENHETAYKPGIMFENELFLLSASKSDAFDVNKQEMNCVGAIKETLKGSELPTNNFQANGNEDLLGCNIYTSDKYPTCLFVWDENDKLFVYELCDGD